MKFVFWPATGSARVYNICIVCKEVTRIAITEETSANIHHATTTFNNRLEDAVIFRLQSMGTIVSSRLYFWVFLSLQEFAFLTGESGQ